MHSLEPGDIVEIKTPGGLAYLQLTHQHPSYPEVVRAFAGLHSTPLEDLDAIVKRPVIFTGLVPLADMLRKKRLTGRHVGRVDLPDSARTFPTFRMPIRDRNGEVVYWWFWDGEGLSYSAKPEPESETWPQREVIGAADLLSRLQQGAKT